MQIHSDIITDDGYGPDQKIERTMEEFINRKLKLDKWEESGGEYDGCLGQCGMVIKQHDGCYEATLFLWDEEFNDSDLVANWFYEAGASIVNTVSAVLYDGDNGDRDGKVVHGGKQWLVVFTVANDNLEPAAQSTNPISAFDLESARYYRDYDDRYWAVKKLQDKIQTLKTQVTEQETIQAIDSILSKMNELGLGRDNHKYVM